MRSSDSTRSRLALALALGAGAVVTVAAPVAQATPTFPDVIARELQLAGPPACAICHAGSDTRRGTVTTPFGTTMRARGLVAYSEPSLVNALKAIEAERKDSDGDGVADVDELRSGTDPSLAAGESLADPPEYGCAVTPSRGLASGPGAFALTAVAVAVVARLVRGRRAERSPKS